MPRFFEASGPELHVVYKAPVGFCDNGTNFLTLINNIRKISDLFAHFSQCKLLGGLDTCAKLGSAEIGFGFGQDAVGPEIGFSHAAVIKALGGIEPVRPAGIRVERKGRAVLVKDGFKFQYNKNRRLPGAFVVDVIVEAKPFFLHCVPSLLQTGCAVWHGYIPEYFVHLPFQSPRGLAVRLENARAHWH